MGKFNNKFNGKPQRNGFKPRSHPYKKEEEPSEAPKRQDSNNKHPNKAARVGLKVFRIVVRNLPFTVSCISNIIFVFRRQKKSSKLCLTRLEPSRKFSCPKARIPDSPNLLLVLVSFSLEQENQPEMLLKNLISLNLKEER